MSNQPNNPVRFGRPASGNDSNYTVMMPPTPDNQPGGDAAARGGGNKAGTGPERRVSVIKSESKSMLPKSQTQDFDHNRYLFESKGKYGIGNAYWSEDAGYEAEEGMSMNDFMDKPWKPLTRKVPIPAGVLSPYRYDYTTTHLDSISTNAS